MKKKSAMLVILMPSLIILLLASCQKEAVYTKTVDEEISTVSNHGPVVRAYRDSFDTPLRFVPDIGGGWTYPNNAPAWFPGSGEGNATHMGNVSVYINSHTVRNSGGGVIAYHSPVTMFFASELSAFQVPSNVSGISFDDKGNSVWMRIAPEGLLSARVSPTRINLDGPMLIVGGTGKFTGATGETSFHGYFNPQNLNEATFWQNGWIAY